MGRGVVIRHQAGESNCAASTAGTACGASTCAATLARHGGCSSSFALLCHTCSHNDWGSRAADQSMSLTQRRFGSCPSIHSTDCGLCASVGRACRRTAERGRVGRVHHIPQAAPAGGLQNATPAGRGRTAHPALRGKRPTAHCLVCQVGVLADRCAAPIDSARAAPSPVLPIIRCWRCRSSGAWRSGQPATLGGCATSRAPWEWRCCPPASLSSGW